jgi:hypothetical protein
MSVWEKARESPFEAPWQARCLRDSDPEEGNTLMKKLMLLLALAAMPMVAFADTPAKTSKKTHKKSHKTASPAPEASPAATASPAAKSSSTTTKKAPAAKASPSPEAK